MHILPLGRWGLAALSAGLSLSAMARPSLACSCGQMTPAEAIGQVPAIFSGQVVDVQRGQPPTRRENLTATIVVRDRWKGEVANRVTVYGSTESSSCGYSHFPVGEVVTLLAYPVESHGPWHAGFTTDACTMGIFYDHRTAMPGLLDEFRAQRERTETAVRAAPAAPAPLLERARVLERWKDPAAIGAYTDLVALAPTMEAAQLGLARALLQGRRLNDAKAAVARALALAPSDPEAIRLDVQLRILTGDTAALGRLHDFHGLTVPELDRSGRDLRRWDFGEAHVDALKLAGADLREADLRGLQAFTADLAGARLDGARMAGVRLPWASLPRASLRGVAGPDVAFTKADLTGAVLDGASLPGADFRGAKLAGASFGRAQLVGADFNGADLDGADLSRADLRGANLKDAYYGCRTRLPRGLTPQGLGMVLADPSAPPCR